jgi:prepilin-type N-terminal cleavage/methylation domain-containing protein
MRFRRYAAAAGRRLASERGYSLSEMLVVLAIIGIVVGALTQLFVSASTAQVDMTRRFEAQQNARLTLDKLRREIHCASDARAKDGTPLTPPTYYDGARFTLGGYCPTNPTKPDPVPKTAYATWCAAPVSGQPNRYEILRYVTTDSAAFVTTCGSSVTGTTRQRWADFVTKAAVFTYTPSGGGLLGTVGVEVPVDLTPSDLKQRYELKDDIVLRNTPRTP